MGSSIDAALGRVAVVVRGLGAAWMAALAVVHAVTGQLDQPVLALVVVALGAGWATAVALGGRLARARGDRPLLLVADLVVVAVVVLTPAVAGETGGYTGGYPFAALFVGLAVAGARGVWIAAGALIAYVLLSLLLVGAAIGPFVLTQVLFYVFGALVILAVTRVLRRAEQRARTAEAALVVATERAETAAHLHDSVLQTLALVHRRAEDPGEVRALVRAQERDLRTWLFGGSADADATLDAAVTRLAGEVESRHAVAVTAVVSGGARDLPATPLGPLVAAAGEALSNAARHAGVDAVDLYVEVDGDEVVVWVRDRGRGFDTAAIPADRHGVRGSLVDRMARAGGRAVVTSAPGRGTEVELRLPRADRAEVAR